MGVETALIATAVLGVASAGVGAYSAIQQGKAAKANANYQSAVSANNAALSQANAEQARRSAGQEVVRANTEEANSIRKSRAIIGAQVASTAARGLLVDQGSAVDLREDTAVIYGETQSNIRDAGNRGSTDLMIRAFNYEQQGANQIAESGLLTQQGKSAQSAAGLAATGAILGGVSSAAGAYGSYSKYSDMRASGVARAGVEIG